MDACVLLAGNSFDQGIWPRRTKENLIVNGSSASLSRSKCIYIITVTIPYIPSAQSETNLSEKVATPQTSTQAAQKPLAVDLSEKA